MNHTFQDVTLLITNYNRSLSLENLLRTLEELECSFAEIIVTDDGSEAKHLDRIKKLQQEIPFRLLTVPQNKGAGHNMNKGQHAVKTPYTLFVEDDFEPASQFPAVLEDALHQLEARPDLDIVRFYAYFNYPYLTPYSKNFSEMVIPPYALNYRKLYYYSDHPHLRRSSFLEKFGDFAENIAADKTEYEMCVSFIQKKGKGLFYNDFENLFLHNNLVEGSTIYRKEWNILLQRVYQIFFMDVYRQIKHNYDLYVRRQSMRL